jgi:hypothetical protein
MVKNQGSRFLGVVLMASLIVFASSAEAKSLEQLDAKTGLSELARLDLSLLAAANQLGEPSHAQNAVDANMRNVIISLFAHFLSRKDYTRAYEMQLLLDEMTKKTEESSSEQQQEVVLEKRAAKRRTFFVGKKAFNPSV